MGYQLGGTGQILPLHVFWTCHAGSRRSASRVQCRVARCDMGLPAHTSHPLSRLFACFAGSPFLSQSEVVTETQFLIGLRVLCGLLCPALSTLHWVRWATVFEKQSGTLRAHGLRGPCEQAIPVFRLANIAYFVVVATPRCAL